MANTFSRIGALLQRDLDGSYSSVATGIIRDAYYSGGVRCARIDPVGVQRLNNPASPATQTPANLPAGTYCHWWEGPGQSVLSGGPVGTASAGNPVVFTLGGATAVTFTVTGVVAGQSRFQCETGKSPTSFIDGGVAPTARNEERLAIDLPDATCQDMTFYAKLRELGDPGASSNRIFQFSSVAGPPTGPYWAALNGSGTNNFSGRLHDGVTQQNIPSFGSYLFTDVVELRAWIDVLEGKHHLTVTLNGGAESAPGNSPLFAMPASFSAALLNIGGNALAAGLPMSIEGLALVQGIQTLATMRAIAIPLTQFGRRRRRSRIAALIS